MTVDAWKAVVESLFLFALWVAAGAPAESWWPWDDSGTFLLVATIVIDIVIMSEADQLDKFKDE